MVFDFVEGGAGQELAVARNQNRFDEILLQPRVLEDVSKRSLETSFLNYSLDVPFGIAQMGMCISFTTMLIKLCVKLREQRTYHFAFHRATS